MTQLTHLNKIVSNYMIKISNYMIKFPIRQYLNTYANIVGHRYPEYIIKNADYYLEKHPNIKIMSGKITRKFMYSWFKYLMNDYYKFIRYRSVIKYLILNTKDMINAQDFLEQYYFAIFNRKDCFKNGDEVYLLSEFNYLAARYIALSKSRFDIFNSIQENNTWNGDVDDVKNYPYPIMLPLKTLKYKLARRNTYNNRMIFNVKFLHYMGRMTKPSRLPLTCDTKELIYDRYCFWAMYHRNTEFVRNDMTVREIPAYLLNAIINYKYNNSDTDFFEAFRIGLEEMELIAKNHSSELNKIDQKYLHDMISELLIIFKEKAINKLMGNSNIMDNQLLKAVCAKRTDLVDKILYEDLKVNSDVFVTALKNNDSELVGKLYQYTDENVIKTSLNELNFNEIKLGNWKYVENYVGNRK